MPTRQQIAWTIIAASCFASMSVLSADDSVPAWFQLDPNRPYAIFDAWKELSTREASICLGENWQVLAGRLQDENGQPLGNTPISISYYDGIRGYSVHLQTDHSGHFIIYSPYTLEIAESSRATESKGPSVVAAPGFPNSSPGFAFAGKNKGIRQCQSKLLLRQQDRAFYVLFCPGDSTFKAEDFRRFEQEYMSRKSDPRPPWRDRHVAPEGRPERWTMMRRYQVRVVDVNDKPVDAIVKYDSTEIAGGTQIRQTDVQGRCELDDRLPLQQITPSRRADDKIMKVTTVDAPALGVGPVSLNLKPDVENIIRLHPPATVQGRVIDHLGRPHPCQLWLRYKRPAQITFEGRFATEGDGTFRFDRIMPNEEFTIATDGFNSHSRQHPSASSELISLKSNEVRKEITIQVPLASAIRGIVASEGGDLVKHSLYLDYGPDIDRRHYVGTASGPWGPNDGRFGFFGLGAAPFRIRVPGWDVEPADEIQLEPGELRFIRVVLKREAAHEPEP